MYSSEGPFRDFLVEDRALPSHSCIIDEHINCLIFLCDCADETGDAGFISDVELLQINAGIDVFFCKLLFRFLSKFDISAGHDNIPPRLV
jgi:hypothetical protein